MQEGVSVQGEGVSVQVEGGLCSGRSLSRENPKNRNIGPETETPWKEHGSRQLDRK